MPEHPFVISGTVMRGKRLGSRLGFPTANIAYDTLSREWPKEGVYIGVAELDEDARRYLAILNQGRHPTTPEGVPTVEAHLLDFPYEALYGHVLRLTYRAFLRPEQTFASLEALRGQLALDRQAAVQWAFRNEPMLAPRAPSDPKA